MCRKPTQKANTNTVEYVLDPEFINWIEQSNHTLKGIVSSLQQQH